MIHRYLGEATQEIAKATRANTLVFISKFGSADEKVPIKLIVVREVGTTVRRESRTLEIKRLPPTSIMQIRQIVLEAVNQKLLHPGEKVFCIADSSLGEGFEGLMFIFTINDEFMAFTTRDLQEKVESSVFNSVLAVAKELAREGREGRKIGTAFLIGDHESVMAKSKQLVLNPFSGHPMELRNVSDPRFKETLKEFSQIDGVFVIDNEGFVHAAGRYLNADIGLVNFPGLGTRHHACASMTKMTSSVGVVVSESGGTVRVFKGGNLILEERVN
ncbi:MAG: DNA integrity scanning protein DisA nucleotide-binding domain protein [Candidatus Aenigmatarchaeota archaeon]|nr:MAG: DNA integrity scanning protein DisA nucleotide-binding domain protein [Candidatus Aenigmarchaeota archaeon]